MKVIISDVESRKGLDVVNLVQNLYRLPVILAAGKDFGPKLKLIYRQPVFALRSSNYEIFESDLKIILHRFPNESIVYLPVSEKATGHFYSFIENNTYENLKCLLPPRIAFDSTRDKYLFQQYCQQHELPVPKSFDSFDLDIVRANFRPLIVKPRKGEGSVGIVHIDNAEDMVRLDGIDLSKYVVQEKIIDGHKVEGAFFLCENGVLITAYSHKRIRTFPEIGGVTVFSGCDYNNSIINIGSDLLKKLNWSGVAMIEFLFDKESGKWKMIELNPRLWGSVLLSGFNSSNMLLNYVNMSLGRPIEISSLRLNTYIQWLYPFEIMNFMKGKLSFANLVNKRGLDICYINITYGTFWRKCSYFFYFTFNTSSIKRFLKKLRKL